MQLRVVFGMSVGAALLATTGCMVDRTYQPTDNGIAVDDRFDNDGIVLDDDADDDFDDFDDVDTDGLITGVKNGSMVGTIGPASVDQTPDRLAAYDDGWYVSVESVAMLDTRAAMLMLSASNVGDLFQPGTAETFRLDEYDASGANVVLLGCTGANMDTFDEYDVPADEVDVVVEEGDGPGEVVVQLNGRWNSQETGADGQPVAAAKTASATFTLQR